MALIFLFCNLLQNTSHRIDSKKKKLRRNETLCLLILTHACILYTYIRIRVLLKDVERPLPRDLSTNKQLTQPNFVSV